VRGLCVASAETAVSLARISTTASRNDFKFLVGSIILVTVATRIMKTTAGLYSYTLRKTVKSGPALYFAAARRLIRCYARKIDGVTDFGYP
jgi:hypothetical protein